MLLGLIELYPRQDFDNNSAKVDIYLSQKLIVKVYIIIEEHNENLRK